MSGTCKILESNRVDDDSVLVYCLLDDSACNGETCVADTLCINKASDFAVLNLKALAAW